MINAELLERFLSEEMGRAFGCAVDYWRRHEDSLIERARVVYVRQTGRREKNRADRHGERAASARRDAIEDIRVEEQPNLQTGGHQHDLLRTNTSSTSLLDVLAQKLQKATYRVFELNSLNVVYQKNEQLLSAAGGGARAPSSSRSSTSSSPTIEELHQYIEDRIAVVQRTFLEKVFVPLVELEARGAMREIRSSAESLLRKRNRPSSAGHEDLTRSENDEFVEGVRESYRRLVRDEFGCFLKASARGVAPAPAAGGTQPELQEERALNETWLRIVGVEVVELGKRLGIQEMDGFARRGGSSPTTMKSFVLSCADGGEKPDEEHKEGLGGGSGSGVVDEKVDKASSIVGKGGKQSCGGFFSCNVRCILL